MGIFIFYFSGPFYEIRDRVTCRYLYVINAFGIKILLALTQGFLLIIKKKQKIKNPLSELKCNVIIEVTIQKYNKKNVNKM